MMNYQGSFPFHLLVLNPMATPDYSGPTVLLNRLYGDLPGGVRLTGLLPQNGVWELAGENVTAKQLRGVKRSTVKWQLEWSLRASVWIIRNRSSIDFAHVHGTYLYALLPAAVLRLLGITYGLFPLSADGEFKKNSKSGRIPGLDRIRRFAVSGATVGFALSASIIDELSEWGLSSRRIVDVFNPVTDSFFQQSESSGAAVGRGRRLGFVGKLGERKQPHLVIECLALLKRSGWEEADALFVGPFEDDRYEERFWNTVDRHDLRDSVEVTGFRSDVAAAMDTMSVFLLPSRQEGLPGALAEALALGVPVGVSKVGAMPEIVEASGSGEVVPNDAGVMASFVSRIWDNDSEYDAMSLAGREFAAANFTSKGVAKRVWRAIFEAAK